MGSENTVKHPHPSSIRVNGPENKPGARSPIYVQTAAQNVGLIATLLGYHCVVKFKDIASCSNLRESNFEGPISQSDTSHTFGARDSKISAAGNSFRNRCDIVQRNELGSHRSAEQSIILGCDATRSYVGPLVLKLDAGQLRNTARVGLDDKASWTFVASIRNRLPRSIRCRTG